MVADIATQESEAVRKFGASRWNLIKQVLGWKGNFIAGMRVYEETWFKPAYGKYSVAPADADSGLQWMVEQGYLRPSKLAIQPQRAPWVGIIGYNSAYIKDTLMKLPVPGHYVDWDYEVLFDVDKFQPTWETK